ncbi:tyrosine-type recombinase/integrase [Ferrimonas balearica]|uniref:tyrosine-type recombinase/integrase n=1 Tax=Ferrimonas balearica TaxID=44012 RepID=UPI001C95262E|nr:tyrosine-type recombinase/integrase [Ferrimonas balearica]MBY5981268.1 site-specific integrase [Ferrimonas balearica]
MKTDTKHLKLRGNVWWYHRNVPTKARHLFEGKATLSESLGTGDIREARAKRDILNGRLEERIQSTPSADRYRFNELVRELTLVGGKQAATEHGLSPEEMLPHLVKEDDAMAWEAWHQVVSNKQAASFGCTLRDALRLWKEKNSGRKTRDTLTKSAQAVDKYLSWLHLRDIQLRDINKRQVHDFISYLSKQYADTSVSGFVSRLRSVWKYASSLGEAEGECPFDGHETKGRVAKEKKQPFSAEQMETIRAYANTQTPSMRLLILLGIYTGCRISELCNLKVGSVIHDEGIVALSIDRGKTSAATRTIPVANHLVEGVLALTDSRSPEEPLLGLDGKSASREFSRFKTAEVSESPTQCFHSFRVMFSTALQRGGVSEYEAAALLGHARGTTMTYGYYSKGYLLPQLKSALERAVPYL